jgi:uncharacterized membrane protein YfcA
MGCHVRTLVVRYRPTGFRHRYRSQCLGVTSWMLLVPILFVFFGFDLYLTLFISLLIDCSNALVMTFIAGRNGLVAIKMALVLSLIASVAVIAGVNLGTTFIPEHQALFKSPALVVNVFNGAIIQL